MTDRDDKPQDIPSALKPPAPDADMERQAQAKGWAHGAFTEVREGSRWLVGSTRLAQSLMLEEQGPERLVRLAALLIVTMIGVFIAWASVTRITEVAVSSGEVAPVGSVQRIQHLEGGMMRALHVAEGDLVEEEQILVELDDAVLLPELEQLRARLEGLELQAEQLRAVTTGEVADLTSSDSRYSELAEAQAALLEKKRQAVAAQKDVLNQQIRQQEEELKLFQSQQRSARKQVKLLREQVRMRRELARKGLQSKVVVLQNERELAEAESRLDELLGKARRTKEAITEAEGRLTEMETRVQVDASEELNQTMAELAELRESIQQTEDRVRRLKIASPVRGVVQGLQTETVGGVISAGSTILQVIPLDAEMIVEARVSTLDIGFVRVGQPVTIKVSTYDFTRYGGIEGTVERISATTFQDEQGLPFYRARIQLARNHVGDDPERNLVVPGMTVIADIKTGEKTLLEYLLKPVYRAVNEGFRER